MLYIVSIWGFPEVPGGNRVVWGARTLMGADGLASEWKYVPVRRLFNHTEVSMHEGTQWAVSEPISLQRSRVLTCLCLRC